MIVIAICIISILLLIIVLFIRAINEGIVTLTSEIKKVWVIGANVTNSIDYMTKSIELYRADFKLTFDNDFEKRVVEMMKLDMPLKDTMQIIGMDGKPHTVPIDKGY